VRGGDLVPLRCSREVIGAVATDLKRFGPAEGGPDWLVSAVWLCTGDAEYVATASTCVLSDGYIARPLAIEPIQGFVERLGAELPDVSARLLSRGRDFDLPAPDRPPAPASLERWPEGPYATSVLIRVSERAATLHEVACALLFLGEGARQLLVGTDPFTAAMVVSEDEALIARYRQSCESLTAGEYGSRCGA